MGATLGTGDKKSLNVDLNIVPFIDLLSCLTAFLMVAAVWVNIARLEIRPTGRAHDGTPCLDDDCEKPKLSVLLDADQIWVGVSRVNDFTKIPRSGADYDWAKLEDVLRTQKKSPYFEAETAIEVAAESTAAHPVTYQSVIAATDVAVKTGFIDVGVTDPRGLSAYPSM